MSPEAIGVFAFGVPTTASDIPATGSASYSALVAGISADKNYYMRGSAMLQFDFGEGALSGHFDPMIFDQGGGARSLGRYTFINTVFGVGSTNYSGQLANPAVTGLGSSKESSPVC